MTKNEVVGKFDPLGGSDAVNDFIEHIYDDGYIILNPHEIRQINWVRIFGWGKVTEVKE